MDAISPSTPTTAHRTVRLRVVGGALAVTALATLGARYALGTNDQPATNARVYVGSHATWVEAARESAALKQRAAARAGSATDIRYERVR